MSLHLLGFSVLALAFVAILLINIFSNGSRTRLNGCTWPSILTVLRIEEDERLLKRALKWIRLMRRAKRVKRRFLLDTAEGEGEEEREKDGEGERGVEKQREVEERAACVDAVQRCMQSLQRQW
jgi:hypothetical protein